MAPPSRTAKVQREERVIEISGTVRAADVAQLASRFGGFVISLPAKAGMQVKKGTLLALLDDKSWIAQREKILASKEEARRSAEAADAQRRLATNTFERINVLYQKKSASLQEFEEAQSRKEASEAAYQAALKHIAQTESDLKDVTASSDYLRIVAPFHGTITTVSADTGTFVNPGQTFIAMENPAVYQVIFSLEEDLLGSITAGKEIQVLIPVISSEKQLATVAEINTSTDIGTQTFLVKANLLHQGELRSGLSARVFLKSSNRTGSLWIPEEFLQQNNEIETVLVKDNNTWQRILVKSGDHQNGKAEILSGLNEGDWIGLTEEKR